MNFAVSIFDFPATVWRDGLINLACIVFAFWYFRAKRFPFLRIGKFGEGSFQVFVLLTLFLLLNLSLGIKVEIFQRMQSDTLKDEASALWFGVITSLIVFAVLWFKNKLMSRR